MTGGRVEVGNAYMRKRTTCSHTQLILWNNNHALTNDARVATLSGDCACNIDTPGDTSTYIIREFIKLLSL